MKSNENRFLIQKVKTVYDKNQIAQVSYINMISCSSPHEANRIANNLPYESIVTDRKYLKSK